MITQRIHRIYSIGVVDAPSTLARGIELYETDDQAIVVRQVSDMLGISYLLALDLLQGRQGYTVSGSTIILD